MCREVWPAISGGIGRAFHHHLRGSTWRRPHRYTAPVAEALRTETTGGVIILIATRPGEPSRFRDAIPPVVAALIYGGELGMRNATWGWARLLMNVDLSPAAGVPLGGSVLTDRIAPGVLPGLVAGKSVSGAARTPRTGEGTR